MWSSDRAGHGWSSGRKLHPGQPPGRAMSHGALPPLGSLPFVRDVQGLRDASLGLDAQSTFRDRLLRLAGEHEELMQVNERLSESVDSLQEELQLMQDSMMEQRSDRRRAAEESPVFDVDEAIIMLDIPSERNGWRSNGERRELLDLEVTRSVMTPSVISEVAARMAQSNGTSFDQAQSNGASSDRKAVTEPGSLRHGATTSLEAVFSAGSSAKSSRGGSPKAVAGAGAGVGFSSEAARSISSDQPSVNSGERKAISLSQHASKVGNGMVLASTQVIGTGLKAAQKITSPAQNALASIGDQLGGMARANPSFSVMTGMASRTRPMKSLTNRRAQNALILREIEQEEQSTEESRCVLDPVGRFRLSWDFGAFVLLMYELWSVPMLAIFVGNLDIPLEMDYASWVVTCFFALDILLNFFTGYFNKGSKVMSNCLIVRNYMKYWLWLDVVATIPWDVVFAGDNNGGSKLLRFGKATEAMRTLRRLKLLRAIRLVSQMSKANAFTKHLELSKSQRIVFKALQVSLGLCVVSHVNGSAWAALQMDWIAQENVQTFGMGLRLYFQSFHWAACALILGEVDPPKVDGPGVWTLEIAVAAQRVGLIIVSMVYYSNWFGNEQDKGRSQQIRADALKYLRRHKVGFETQVQVLFNLHETSRARNQQRRFEELMARDLPSELRQTVCMELWAKKLHRLGLLSRIQDWNCDFVPQLVLMCREEVHATKAVLFRQGERSVSAYYIISGKVRALTDMHSTDYVEDEWVGERALINPRFRRNATVLTKALTSLMVVPTKETHDLMEQLDLTKKFQVFCNTELCHGLCGRCGMVGDHFTEDCNGGMMSMSEMSCLPSSKSSMGDRASRTIRASWRVTRRASSKDDKGPKCSRQLEEYLKAHNLKHLKKPLEALHITDLQLLIDLEPYQLQELELAEPLSEEQKRALTPEFIDEYIHEKAQTASGFAAAAQTCHQHFGFLSHYKIEAGTEAALMRSEMDQLVKEDDENPAHLFDTPFFLDSEDLQNLKDLQLRVHNSHNLIVFLSKGVFTRPWCLVEIVTAVRAQVALVPVHLSKPGMEFRFPDEEFYTNLKQGKLLDKPGNQVLTNCGITLDEVENAIRELLANISLPFSPHRPALIRRAELTTILNSLSCDRIQIDGVRRVRSVPM